MLNKKTFLVVFLFIQLIAMLQFFWNKHYFFILETLIIILAVCILTYLDIKKSLPVSNYLYVIVLAAISGHTIGGEFFGLYGFPLYDKFLHILGGYTFGLLGYLVLGIERFSLPCLTKSVILITIGLSLGATYELWEFSADQLTKPAVPYQAGLVDTDLDLLADLAGSVLAVLHLQKGQSLKN